MLTEASAWPLPTPAFESRPQESMRTTVAALNAAAPEREDPSSPTLAPVAAALSRCERWHSTVDVMIQPTPRPLAARMLHATSALAAVAAPERTQSTERCRQMLLAGAASRKSEFVC